VDPIKGLGPPRGPRATTPITRHEHADPDLMKEGYLGVDETGTYALFLDLEEEVHTEVGALGRCRFPGGLHVYAGSAMNGLRARLARHVRREKRVHWHVDRLTTAAGCRVLGAVVFTSPVLGECEIVGALEGVEDAEVRPPRFGASDHGCRGHLVWMGDDGPGVRVAKALLTDGASGGRWLSGEDLWRPGEK